MTATFDHAAPGYDADFTDRRLGRLLRDAVWRHLFDAFQSGDRVLELGCGTGEDAVALARRGVAVHATDASPAMLAATRAKAQAWDLGDHVTTGRLDLADPDAASLDDLFDGAYSDFGALNCVADLGPVARMLARRVRPGGRVVLVVMGPWCPWEWVWFGVRGQLGDATRRLRGPATARVDGGPPFEVHYPSARQLRQTFAPAFRHVQTVGVGVALPPSFASPMLDRWPRLASALARIEGVVAATPVGAWFGDHYLAVFERLPEAG